MKRRDFMRLSLVSAGAGFIAPSIAVASNNKQCNASRDIYYTKEHSGRWSEKVATHLPNIEIIKIGADTTVKIVTAHEMKAYEHYIVKHILLDKEYKFIDEHLFDPTKDSAASTFVLKDYSGIVYALSMCNKHDIWLNSAEI